MNASVKVFPKVGVLFEQEHPLATDNEEQRLFAAVPIGAAMTVELTDQLRNERTHIAMLKSDFRQWAAAVIAMLDEGADTHAVDDDKDQTYGNPGAGPLRPENVRTGDSRPSHTVNHRTGHVQPVVEDDTERLQSSYATEDFEIQISMVDEGLVIAIDGAAGSTSVLMPPEEFVRLIDPWIEEPALFNPQVLRLFDTDVQQQYAESSLP